MKKEISLSDKELMLKQADEILEKNALKNKQIFVENYLPQSMLLNLVLSLLMALKKLTFNKIHSVRFGFLYYGLWSKLLSQLVSIKMLLEAGLPDSAKVIQRALMETIELIIVCHFDIDFAKSFGDVSELYDNNKFWYDNISKGGSRSIRWTQKVRHHTAKASNSFGVI